MASTLYLGYPGYWRLNTQLEMLTTQGLFAKKTRTITANHMFRDFKDTAYSLFESDALFLECCLYCF